jgi:ABC-type uncharacterized transport system involved in gliding motility auxiliary subunit
MQTKSQTLTSIAIAVVLFMGVNIISNETLTSSRLDVTANRLYTLSDGTRGVLSKIDEPITLRLYFSARQFAGVPQYLNYGKRVRDLLEEYVAEADGKLKLEVIEPEPFSEAEDQAVGYGIEQLPLNATGDMGYLGLAGANTMDDELAIPFLNPEREDALEYEVSKLVYTLANPQKRVIGLISDLQLNGGPPTGPDAPPQPAWASINQLKEVFDVRDLARDVKVIDPAIDTLLVVHPKDLPAKTLYAIDQFVLGGGKAMVFVDPLAEEDRPERDPSNPMVMPKVDSNLEPLFKAWGIAVATDKIVGDLEDAVRVSFSGSRGPQEVEYLPWIQLHDDSMNRDDFITSKLQGVNIGTAGHIEALQDATTKLTPLLTTGPKAGFLERDAIFFVRDPNGLREGFTPGDRKLTLSARITGQANTAFPDGPPLDEQEKRGPGDANQLKSASKGINVIVTADTDLLADRFWVRIERFLGMQVPNPFANNADFLINAIDNLGGNDDLISLRSRGEYARPFEVVENIKREAESRFRDREQALRAKLEETENKLRELQKGQGAEGEAILTAEQRKEIELFRGEQLKTRKELRAVQHELGRNIEQLGNTLKLLNIGLIPLLLALIAIAVGALRQRRWN